jgi:hypothetical protein
VAPLPDLRLLGAGMAGARVAASSVRGEGGGGKGMQVAGGRIQGRWRLMSRENARTYAFVTEPGRRVQTRREKERVRWRGAVVASLKSCP